MREPQLLLLDEPLSNLDAKLREQMRVELKRLQKRLGITTVYVTHDQSEALALSDEIAVFNSGKIIQRGTPQDIYRTPKSQFVADFIGSANFLTGKVKEADGGEHVALVETRARPVPLRLWPDRLGRPGRAGQRPARGPHAVRKTAGRRAQCPTGKIAHRVFLGEVVDYLVETGEGEIRVRTKPEVEFRIGQSVHIGVSPQKCVACRLRRRRSVPTGASKGEAALVAAARRRSHGFSEVRRCCTGWDVAVASHARNSR